MRVCIDTNILFSALRNQLKAPKTKFTTSAIENILALNNSGIIRLFITPKTGEEIYLKVEEKLGTMNMGYVGPFLVRHDIQALHHYTRPDYLHICKQIISTDLDDAEIIASAWTHNVEIFITKDESDILSNNKLHTILPFKLFSPQGFLYFIGTV